jgi:hypothetical protein
MLSRERIRFLKGIEATWRLWLEHGSLGAGRVDTSDFLLLFPGLGNCRWGLTSPEAVTYNCVSWAVEDERRRWWEPTPSFYWPPGVAREYSIEAYKAAFELSGYTECHNAAHEPGLQKIALYAVDSEPQHAARQLSDGTWTSKIGIADDIMHETLEALEGSDYGRVVLVMQRVSRIAQPE